jgi:hypothetical protein
MKTKEQELPKWFDGQIYNEGSIVENPFSKEEYELNNVELSMYDFIMGANFLYERGAANNKIVSDLQKGLTWFRKNNPEAYMALLD